MRVHMRIRLPEGLGDLMAFKDDFLKALYDGDSLYDAFVRLSRKNLPSDSDARYQYLCSPQGKYIARDEADVDVYVVKVAERHIPKFRWLYDNLFNAYSDVFAKDIDLVVWGCGCGLDLLALYDRALAQKNPQLWTKVRSVTLVDASKSALERAKQISEVLFPLAKNVQMVVCDLTKPQEVKRCVCLRSLTAYLPRIHLISNLLDLFEDAVPFATAIKESAARNIRPHIYFNDLVVAFSPEYRGGRVARNIEAFRDVWDEHGLAEPMKTVGDEPLNCEFCAFAYRTLRGVNDPCYRAYMGGRYRALNALVEKCPTVEQGFDFHAFVTALSKIKVNGINFFRVYQWVEVRRFKGQLERMVFVPGPEISPRPAPCVVEFGCSPVMDVKKLMGKSSERALTCLKNRMGDEAVVIGGKEEDFTVWVWCQKKLVLYPSTDRTNENRWLCDGQIDYSLYFRIDVEDAEPLPNLESCMDEKQREVIYSRTQYRKIRGSAGCGKSTTMMWHAVMAVLRIHLPVLLVCRTVTLFNRNKRRIAATLKQEIPELEYVDSDLVQFMTLDKVLCQHQWGCSCLWKRCAHCKGCGHKPSFICSDYRGIGGDGRQLDNREKSECCDACRDENIDKLSRKRTQYAAGSTVYGAVMIDEVQSVSPSLVQAVVNLTYGGNPARECYVFCDERQCLNPEAVEIDPEKGKLRVKVPDRGAGYGRWVDLNKPYRTSSDFTGRLADVAARLQALTAEKYGAVELAKHIAQRQMTLSSQAVFSVRRSAGLLMSEVQAEIFALKELGADSVTVVCDDADDVRLLLRCPEAKEWRSTHLPAKSHVEEQRLRMSFREDAGGVQLTTVALAQGWDFGSVVYVCKVEGGDGDRNVLENVLTGATRATSRMRILDRSPSGWLYETLKELN